jgi:hypothetical protein
MSNNPEVKTPLEVKSVDQAEAKAKEYLFGKYREDGDDKYHFKDVKFYKVSKVAELGRWIIRAELDLKRYIRIPILNWKVFHLQVRHVLSMEIEPSDGSVVSYDEGHAFKP